MAALIPTLVLGLLGYGVIMPLLPFYASRFGATPVSITALVASYSLVQMVAAPCWGAVSDRFGRKPAIIASLSIAALAYLAMAYVDNLSALFIARAFQGAGAANIAVAQAYLADVTPPEERGKGMATLGAIFALGLVIGPTLGSVIAGPHPNLHDLSRPFLVASGLSVLGLICAALFLKEPTTRQQAPMHPSSLGSRSLILPLLPIFIVTLISMSAFSGMESTMALWGMARFGWGTAETGYVLGVAGLVMLVMQLGGAKALMPKFGETRILFSGLIAIAIGLVVMAVSYRPAVGVGANMLLAVGFSLTQPSLASLISRATSPDQQGKVMGLNQSVGALGRIGGPLMAGMLFTISGPALSYVTGAAMALLAAAIVLRFALLES